MHFTFTALLEATKNWHLIIVNGLINSVLFLDLKKAFDTVDRSISAHLFKIQSMFFLAILGNRGQQSVSMPKHSVYIV